MPVIKKKNGSDRLNEIQPGINNTKASIDDIESFLSTHLKSDDPRVEVAINQLLNIARPKIVLNYTHHRRLRFIQAQRRCMPQNDGCEIDLEVAGLVKVHHPDPGSLCYGEVVLTQAGLFELSRIREKKKNSFKKHESFGSKLAEYLGNQDRLTWENIEIRLSNTLYGTDSNPMRRPITVVRPDVYSIKSTQVEKEIKPTVHEVKVSRADFLSDIRSGKWEGYRPIADYVYFACPEGVAKKTEIPDGCGLLELRSEQWVVVKRARRHPVILSPRQWIKLLQATNRNKSNENIKIL